MDEISTGIDVVEPPPVVPTDVPPPPAAGPVAVKPAVKKAA